MAARYLIVNADDFGQSPGVNAGIAAAHERGIVTSASLMVRWPAAEAAAAYARETPGLSVGLHLDLGESVCRDGGWLSLYQVVPADDEEAVRAEVARQLEAFRRLLGRDPTHLDSHQHLHCKGDPAAVVVAELAAQLRVPLRRVTPGICYRGDFYGQNTRGDSYPEAVGVDCLVRIVNDLPEGVTELGCHPALWNDVHSMYGAERQAELATLCHPRIRAAVDAAGVELVPFGVGPTARSWSPFLAAPWR